MSNKEETFSKEDLLELIKELQKAYEEAGKKLKTAVLLEDENTVKEVLLDNRKPDDIN